MALLIRIFDAAWFATFVALAGGALYYSDFGEVVAVVRTLPGRVFVNLIVAASLLGALCGQFIRWLRTSGHHDAILVFGILIGFGVLLLPVCWEILEYQSSSSQPVELLGIVVQTVGSLFMAIVLGGWSTIISCVFATLLLPQLQRLAFLRSEGGNEIGRGE